MFQKEVGDKTYDAGHKNQMSSLYSLCNTYFETRKLCKVPSGSFSPPPKVESIVISFKRIDSPIVSLDQFLKFESFLRKAFANRRKQLGKVLSGHYPNIIKTLEELEISPKIRAEALTLKEVQDIFKKVMG